MKSRNGVYELCQNTRDFSRERFRDNVDFSETKVGIITNLEDNKIKMKEINKYGNFYKDSEIYLDEIQLLAVKNYRLEL